MIGRQFCQEASKESWQGGRAARAALPPLPPLICGFFPNRLSPVGETNFLSLGGPDMKYSSKKAFLEDIQTEYAQLEELLRNLTPEQMCRPGVCSKWSVKDILAHLNEWHLMAH